MIFKDYYKILGLENSRVSASEIKAAYREQAKLYHPDVRGESSYSEERFKDINEAYKILANSVSKRKYDRIWNNRATKNRIKYEEGKSGSSFFSMFFGDVSEEQTEKNNEVKKKNKKVPAKGDNIETEIEVSIQDAFYGVNKKISLRTIDGKMKNFDVKIPAGIRNNEKIRLLGQGKAGINGGSSGDLFIKINIQNDSKFQIKGYNLYTDLCLTPWEAALGTKANVVGIDDEASVYVPEGIQSGEKITIPGKGYKDSKGGRGDLIANVKIMVPKQLTEKEKTIFWQLKEVSNFNPRNNC